jgi:hypothetical protein
MRVTSYAIVFGMILGSAAVAAAAGPVATDQGAAAGSGTALQLLTQAKADIGDVPGHELSQAVGDDELHTPDKIAGVSFDGAKVKLYRQSDLVNGSGTVRGYAVWEAKSGEKLFLIVGYTVPPYPAGKDVAPFEGTFQWIGGTGSLERIVGNGTIEGEISRKGEARYRWAGTYQQKSK